MNPTNGENNGNGLLLYLHNYSFYAQKVILALHEKKLKFRSHVIDITKGEQYNQAFLEVNPRGEVPALRDGVKVIPDSGRIIDYLEDNFSDENHPRLMPSDPVTRQKVQKFRDLLDRIPANTVTMGSFYHTEFVRSPKLPFIAPVRGFMRVSFEGTGDRLKKFAEKMPEYRQALLKKAEDHEKTFAVVTSKENFVQLLNDVDETLGKVEDQLKTNEDGNSWLVCQDFTVADIALTTLLYRLDALGLSHRLFPKATRPLVASYLSRAAKRPSYQATFPGFFSHVKAFLGFKVLIGAIVMCSVLVVGGVYMSVKRK